MHDSSIELARKIRGMDEKAQMGVIDAILCDRFPFNPVGGRKKQLEGFYLIDNDIVIARVRREGIPYAVIMDKELYDMYLAGDKGIIFFDKRRDNGLRPIVCGRKRGKSKATYARIWQLPVGWKSEKGKCVDHNRYNTLINLRRELRVCANADNRRNSPKFGTFEDFKEFNPANADEYTYSLARDCSHTLYAYVLMLLGVISEEQLAEVNMIVNSRRLLLSNL